MLCYAMLWEKYDTARTKGWLEWMWWRVMEALEDVLNAVLGDP